MMADALRPSLNHSRTSASNRSHPSTRTKTRGFADLGRQSRAKNEKFTVGFFSSKTLLWSRRIDSSRFRFKRLLFAALHQKNDREAHKRLKRKKKKMHKKQQRPDKGSVLIPDVLSAFHADVPNSLCLFARVPLSSGGSFHPCGPPPPPLWGELHRHELWND